MIELSSALGTPRLKRKLGIRSHTAVRQKKKKRKKRNQVRKDKNNKKQKTKKTKEAEGEFH